LLTVEPGPKGIVRRPGSPSFWRAASRRLFNVPAIKNCCTQLGQGGGKPMQIVREQDQAYRGGTSGVKYLFRGPRIDWGVILFAPGEQLGRHLHREVEETFYFVEGAGGRLIVNDREHPIAVGTAFRIEPGEVHNVVNDTPAPLKAVFVKTPYLPKDKVDV